MRAQLLKIITELQEIKKLLQVIVSNQEQKNPLGKVTVDVTGIDEVKKQLEEIKNSTF